MKKFLIQLIVAIDQLINTVTYIRDDGFGYADETLSARAWRLRRFSSKPYKAINLLFFWQENHCRGAYHSEMTRKNMPNEYRGKI